MGRLKRFGSSPALIVAGLAIAIAITTTAVAGPQAIISALNKKEKKQVKNISNQQITNRAPGLSVSSAKTAGNGYLGYARISATGTVSQAKNIAAANVTHPVAGAYCFNGLPFDLQNVQASADANGTASEIMVETPGAGDCANKQAGVFTFTVGTQSRSDRPFFVLFN